MEKIIFTTKKKIFLTNFSQSFYSYKTPLRYKSIFFTTFKTIT